ncbi:MAG: site-2 protease family protein [Planctomycetota bacterium]
MNPVRLFSIAGIPVLFSPWFLLIILMISQGRPMQQSVVLVLAITVSLLVHEFGHGFTALYYGLRPHIVIHGFGGYCAHDPARRDRDDAFIVAAGPAAGFALGAIAYGVSRAITATEENVYVWWLFERTAVICLYLNALNLLPCWPLDGGQLFRLGMLKLFSTRTALRITHLVGTTLCVAIAIYAMRMDFLAGAMIAAYLGYMNIAVLRGQSSGGAVRSQHRFAKGLLKDAIAARAAEDWQETARLSHQIRAEPNLPPPVLNEVWVLLGISTTQLGKHREALAYLKRARPTPEIVEAWLHCLEQLREPAETQALLASDAFLSLRKDVQEALASRYGR